MAHAAFTHSPSFDVMLEHSRRFEYTDRAPLQVKASSEAVTLLAGPFTVGPGEWISTVFAIPPLLQYGDRIAAFTGDAVDAKGQVIPYPPMHLHHIHVAHGHSTHSYETHGDYATMKSMGTRGYTTSSAPHCRRVPCGEPLMVNAQLNDVRAGSSGMAGHVASGRRADELEATPPLGPSNATLYAFWLRIRFSFGASTCPIAVKLALWYPCPSSTFCRTDHWRRYDAGGLLPGRVSWWTLRSPVGGQLMQPWTHSHRGRYAGLVLARGVHTDWWRQTHGGGGSVEAARARVLESLGDRVVCHDDPSAPTSETLVDSRTGVESTYDRQGAIVCRPPAMLELGEPLTVVAFSARRFGDDGPIYPQHTMIFAHVAHARDGQSHGAHGRGANETDVFEGFAQDYGYFDLKAKGGSASDVVEVNNMPRFDAFPKRMRDYLVRHYELDVSGGATVKDEVGQCPGEGGADFVGRSTRT